MRLIKSSQIIAYLRSKTYHLLLVAAAILGLQSQATAQTYTVVDLGTLGGNSTFVAGMSNSGWVTGSSTDGVNSSWAFLYRAGSGMTNLGGFPGADNSQATAVNDLGQVTGNSALSGSGFSHAALWSGGPPTDLGSFGTPTETYNSFGLGINNGGQVVGRSGSQTFGEHAFLWNPITQTLNDVFAVSGLPSAWGINSAGHYTGGNTTGAVFVSGTTVTTLGPGTTFAINDNDQAAGYQYPANGPMATLYSGGATIALGTLGGYSSIAFDIDNAGNVVGAADSNLDFNNGVPHAFLYTAANGMQDLNSMIPGGTGWELQEARGIADNGVIVGNGLIGGQPHGFMLIPDNGVDTNPPSTMAFTSGNIAGPRTVGLRATDAEGPVASTSYTYNASTSTYMGPFSVGLGATQIVEFNSVDYAGNVEGTHQLDVVYNPAANNFPVTVQYETVTSPGNASVTVSTSGTPPPSGFGIGSPVRYYDITTTASYSGSLIVGISYAGINFPGTSTPRIFHYEGGAWVDSTYAVDTVNEMIYAQTTSLSPFAVAAPLQPFLSLTANPTSVYNGLSSEATLTLKYPATSMTTPWAPSTRVPGQLVKLSSASSAATFPVGPASNGGNVFVAPDGNTYLMVPEGITTIAFTVNTGAVTASTAAKLTAELYGFKISRTLTVTPEKVASVTLNPVSVYNGDTSTGTVTLTNPAFVMQSPFGVGTVPGVMVRLSSPDPAVATFVTGGGQNPDGSSVFEGPDGNTYMLIPQGNTTGTFTVDTGSVPAATVVALTATLFASVRTANLTVQPEKVSSVSVSPTSVFNGGSSNGTVTLTNPAFEMPSPFGSGTVPGAMVQLTSGNSAGTIVTGGGQNPDGSNVFLGPDNNTYMFIPQGNTTGTFTVATTWVGASTPDVITALLNGTSRTATLTIKPTLVLTMTTAVGTLYSGQSTNGTVTLNSPAVYSPSPFGAGTVPGVMVMLTSSNTLASYVVGGGQNPDGSNVFLGPDGNVYMLIPAGNTSGTYSVVADTIPANASAVLTAALNGGSKSRTIALRP